MVIWVGRANVGSPASRLRNGSTTSEGLCVSAFFTVFQALKCLLGQHRPNRKDVKWDGRSYIGPCKGCGVALRRKARSKWRRERA